MKIVFVSNYLNHHQLPLCNAFVEKEDVKFTFIATTPVPGERRSLGYADMNSSYDYVLRAYEDAEQMALAHKLCEEADVVITGSAPESYIRKRLKEKKVTFRYSERIYRKKQPALKMMLRCIKFFFKYGRHKNLYLLCSSAYTAADYAKTGTFLNKAYKWAYFPEVHCYENISQIISTKKNHSLIWVARLIPLKHPEAPLLIAKKLHEAGYEFELNIIGNGVMEEQLRAIVRKIGLEDKIHLLGSMPPEKVREYMEQSEIFMFTSDRNEGWGAVLNEAMNSGCACVASNVIGAAPFLIEDGVNGYMYKDGDIEDLYEKVKFLIDNPEKRAEIGAAAYKTMTEQWNAENAAERFITLAQAILDGNKRPNLFKNGVCSKAEIIDDRK